MEKAYKDEQKLQREYYDKTASEYENCHCTGEETLAPLYFLKAMVERYDVKSILEVGAGTGDALIFFQKELPKVQIVGIEPSEAMRKIGYQKGLSKDSLIDGIGENLHFENNQFDLVVEFRSLHHVRFPEAVIKEMMRVSRKGILISDTNNFAEGNKIEVLTKIFFKTLGLWKVVDFINTKGKGYRYSEGDGVSYSYSVFNNYKLIKKQYKHIHLLNLFADNKTPILSSTGVVIFAIN